jgi:hypothetical protein
VLNVQISKPNEMEAGPALDALVHTQFLGHPTRASYPPYSTDIDEATKLKDKFQSSRQVSIAYGLTPMPDRSWFARCAVKSDTVEVKADTFPLVICRLVLTCYETEMSDRQEG